MTKIDFLRDKLNIDFNEITSNFIFDLPFEIQLQTFVSNKSNSDHISKYFSVGQEIEFHGESVEILDIMPNSLIINRDSTSENIEISATEALVQNGYLKEGEIYNFEETIDFESKKFIEILKRIEDEINNSVLHTDVFLEDAKENGIDYVLDNINRYMLKNLREEISNEI